MPLVARPCIDVFELQRARVSVDGAAWLWTAAISTGRLYGWQLHNGRGSQPPLPGEGLFAGVLGSGKA